MHEDILQRLGVDIGAFTVLLPSEHFVEVLVVDDDTQAAAAMFVAVALKLKGGSRGRGCSQSENTQYANWYTRRQIYLCVSPNDWAMKSSPARLAYSLDGSRCSCHTYQNGHASLFTRWQQMLVPHISERPC